MFAVDDDYHWFEVVGCDGLIRKWRARTISIDFPEGGWTDVAPYSIVLGLQTDTITDEDLHIDHTETWDVSWDEEAGGTYTLTHTLSCQSDEFANDHNDVSEGWNQAKAWIDSRLAGADYTTPAPTNIKNSLVTSGLDVALGTDYTAYDYSVRRSADEFNGTYSVSETWVLAKDPVFRTWNITNTKSRDDYNTITIEGEFRSRLDRTTSTESTPSNPNAALTAFTTWEAASGPYTEANSVYSGCSALGTCPVNQSVTITEESRGDASTVYGDATRVVRFSYEFSDSDPSAEVSLTKTTDTGNFDKCETRVTINVQIQGHECDCTPDKLTNAQTAYAAINCATEAASIYTGSGTLGLVRSTYSENERDGTIDATCEFSDQFSGGFVSEQRITIGWTCGDINTDGNSKTTYTVEGTVRGTCDGAMPSAPSTGAYTCGGAACCTLRRSSVSSDTVNKVVNYTYEYDDNCTPGLVEVVVEYTNGPDDCDNWTTSVNLSVQGEGCTSADMLANAQTALASATPDSYAPVGSCRTSFRENKNVTRGSIQQTYTYTTECDATLNVTTTDNFDANNCDDSSQTVEGEIKGRCYVAGGGMQAAEDLYASHGPDAYAGSNCLISSRVARNDKAATINFSYEFRSCTDGYEHEQSVATKSDDSDCCSEVTMSGTITPYCDQDTGEAGQVAAGEAAWTAIEATLATDAATYCGDTLALRSTTVARNRKNGQINYTYIYSCCSNSVNGALKESVNITREFPADVVAIIPILGRTCGPIVQDKGTKTVEKCSVAISLLFAKDCSTYSKPSGLEAAVQSIISSAGCCTGAENTYTERDTESWNPRSGQYTRNVTFVCECC
jgi:hypothetical protein